MINSGFLLAVAKLVKLQLEGSGFRACPLRLGTGGKFGGRFYPRLSSSPLAFCAPVAGGGTLAYKVRLISTFRSDQCRQRQDRAG